MQLWLLNPQLSDAPHLVGMQQVLPIAALVMMPLLDAFDNLQPLRVGLVHVFDSKACVCVRVGNETRRVTA